MSYLFQFTCPECGYEADIDDHIYVCPDCQNPLLATYDLYRARKEDYLNHLENLPGMWRFMGLLPIQSKPVATFNFREGDTPIYNLSNVAAAFGLNKIYIKHEGVNPTGNMADRGISVTYSTLEHPTAFYIADNGTRVISASAYAAFVQKKLYATIPRFFPRTFMGECENYGAVLQAVKWNHQEIETVKENSYQDIELFNLDSDGISFFIEGVKTVFLELLWQFKFFLPEIIAIPTGDGLTAIAFWKALDEFQKLGGIIKSQETQIYFVQHENTAPLFSLVHEESWTPPEDFDSIAPDLFTHRVFFPELFKEVVRKHSWHVVKVTTEAIIDTWKKFARISGYLLSAEGSAALAGILPFIKSTKIRNRNVLILNPSLGTRFIDTMGFIRD